MPSIECRTHDTARTHRPTQPPFIRARRGATTREAPRRPPHHQPHRHEGLLRSALARQPRQQPLERRRAQCRRIGGHGRQRRIQNARDVEVVKADHRQVLGHPQPPLPRREYSPAASTSSSQNTPVGSGSAAAAPRPAATAASTFIADTARGIVAASIPAPSSTSRPGGLAAPERRREHGACHAPEAAVTEPQQVLGDRRAAGLDVQAHRGQPVRGRTRSRPCGPRGRRPAAAARRRTAGTRRPRCCAAPRRSRPPTSRRSPRRRARLRSPRGGRPSASRAAPAP